MRLNYFLCLLLCGIGLAGCRGVVGNVIPEKGPSMEDVYDSMSIHQAAKNIQDTSMKAEKNGEADLESIRKTNFIHLHQATAMNMTEMNHFQKLPNPELKLYVYPHFVGQDEIPIPGYYTAFNVYEKTHYALTSEVTH